MWRAWNHGASRSPSGERGLKFRGRHDATSVGASLPIRGAWIEITHRHRRCVDGEGRSPSGERGLKFRRHDATRLTPRRSPSGERGLKSCLVHVPETERHVSLPIRGAWIEILSFTVAASSPCGRSPSGERGLKYLLRNLHHRNGGRSPSGERGLKCVGHGHLAHVVLSLPIRGAWIERNVCATTRRPSPGSLPIRGAWIDISRTCGTASAPPCRSPSGERGLKSEMDVQQHDLGQSLPIRGAWIEIRNIARRSVRHGCRSPSGGRGLK